MVIDDMPRSSDHIPLLTLYLDLQMLFIALAMAAEGLIFLILNKIQPKNHLLQIPTVPMWLFKLSASIGGVTGVPLPKRDQIRKEENSKGKAVRLSAYEGLRIYVALFGNKAPVVVSTGIGNFNGLDSDSKLLENERDPNYENELIKEQSDKLIQEVMKSLQNLQAKEQKLDTFMNDRVNEVDQGDVQLTSNARIKPKNSIRSRRKTGILTLKQRRWLYIAEVMERLVFIGYTLSAILTPVSLFLIRPLFYSSNIDFTPLGKLYFNTNI